MFRRKYGTALCALVLIALPALLNDPFITHLGVRAATYAIVVMGLTLFAGYTGQISLGHAAFFGLAAYLSGMMAKAGVPYLVSVPVATAAVGVLGCLVGMLVLRTSGHYLALASIAVAVIVQVIIKNSTITGGPSGLTAVPAPDFFGWSLTSDLGYYYVLLCMFAGFVILRRVIDCAPATPCRPSPTTNWPPSRWASRCSASQGAVIHHQHPVRGVRRHPVRALRRLHRPGQAGHPRLRAVPDHDLRGRHRQHLRLGDRRLRADHHRGVRPEFGQYNILVYGLLLALVILFLPKGLVDLPNKLKSLRAR